MTIFNNFKAILNHIKTPAIFFYLIIKKFQSRKHQNRINRYFPTIDNIPFTSAVTIYVYGSEDESELLLKINKHNKPPWCDQ